MRKKFGWMNNRRWSACAGMAGLLLAMVLVLTAGAGETMADTVSGNDVSSSTESESTDISGTDSPVASGDVSDPTENSAENSAENPALSVKRLKLTSGQTFQLTLKDNTQKVKWRTSSRSRIALEKTTDPNTVILKAQKAGKAVITAVVNGKKYTCKVTVKYVPKLSRTKKTIKEGKSFNLKLTGTVSSLQISVADSQVVSVQKLSYGSWTVKGITSGKTVITCKVNGKTLTCTVTVKAATNSTDVGLPAYYTGWQTTGGRTYYWLYGKRVKGWQQISGALYYFGTEGMERNCVAGTADEGYHYVDNDGHAVTDTVMQLAVNYLRSNASAAMTRKQQLSACFWKMANENYFTYRWHPDSPCASVLRTYAYDTFTTRIGNCWRFGAAMAYVAKALGYSARVCIGGVTANADQSWLDNHGWCEVLDDDGIWKMMDVSMQMHHSDAYLFMIPRDSYPYRLRCDSIYYLNLSGGSMWWS